VDKIAKNTGMIEPLQLDPIIIPSLLITNLLSSYNHHHHSPLSFLAFITLAIHACHLKEEMIHYTLLGAPT